MKINQENKINHNIRINRDTEINHNVESLILYPVVIPLENKGKGKTRTRNIYIYIYQYMKKGEKQDKTGSRPRYQMFLCAFSLYGITKWAHKYRIPISVLLLKKEISHYTIYFLSCVLGYIFTYFLFIVPLKKAYLFQFFLSFLLQILRFSFLHLKIAHDLYGYLSVDP